MFACTLSSDGGITMQARTLGVLYTTHSWAGALVGIMLFVICMSGSLAMLKEELSYWEARGQRIDEPAEVDWNQVQKTLTEQGIEGRQITLTVPNGLQRHILVRTASEGRGTPASLRTVDWHRGHIGTVEDTPMVGMFRELHKTLYAGFAGRIVVSLFGMAMTMLVLGGLFLCVQRWKNVVRLRVKQGIRVLLTDIHRLTGFWLFPLLLMIAVTGIYSGMGALGTMTLARFAYSDGMRGAMGDLMDRPVRQAPGSAAAMYPLTTLIAAHQQRFPSFRTESITLRHWGQADALLVITGTQPGQLSTPMFEKYSYRATDGVLAQHDTVSGKGFWVQAFVGIAPLHQATYGGQVVRLIYVVGGLVAAVLAWSGTTMWLLRRQNKGHPVAIMPAIVAGVCGGMLVAVTSVLAITSLPVAPGTKAILQPLAMWGSWLLSVLLCFVTPIRKHAVWWMGGWAGCALLFAAVTDVTVSLAQSTGTLLPAFILDVCFAAIAIAMLILVYCFYRKDHHE
jgi:uncharacterized iron-regulated membrane protein